MTETLPSSLYSDAAVFETERAQIFAKSWQLIAHESELAKAGAYVAATVAGFPVIAVRGEDGAIRAFHNVCRHRAGPLAQDGIGECGGALVCKYHGWRYALDGRLASARDFGPAPGFDARAFGLFPLACASWRGFVFINMDSEAAALESVVAPLEARARDIPSSGLIVRSTHELKCNWKTYVENYLEGYHVPVVHPALDAQLGAGYSIEMEGLLQFHRAETRRGAAVSGFWGWMWPCLGINVYASGILMERMWPLDFARTRLDYIFLFPPDAGRETIDRELETSETTTREDIAICEAVQRNLDAGVYRTGVLSPKHEPGVAWFQAEIRKTLG